MPQNNKEYYRRLADVMLLITALVTMAFIGIDFIVNPVVTGNFISEGFAISTLAKVSSTHFIVGGSFITIAICSHFIVKRGL